MSIMPENQTPEERRAERAKWPVRKGRLGDPEFDRDWPPTTPEERLGMVWAITQQVWAFRGIDVAESRVPRHALRLTRRAS